MGKNKIILISVFAVLILAFLAGGFYIFYSKNRILSGFNSIKEGIVAFDSTRIGDILEEAKKTIISPGPLKMGGTQGSVLSKYKIIYETNLQRKNNGGLPSLKENSKLDAAAKAKADDMFKNQYFDHISPSGADPSQLAKKYGYDYITIGENLILGNFKSEKDLVQAWMDSTGHRENILNKKFTEIGVAVVKGVYKGQPTWIAVQEFGLPLSSCPQPSADLKSKIEIYKKQLDSFAALITQINSEINNMNPRSLKYSELILQYNKLVNQYNQSADSIKNLVSKYNSQVNSFNSCVAGK